MKVSLLITVLPLAADENGRACARKRESGVGRVSRRVLGRDTDTNKKALGLPFGKTEGLPVELA
jgi:hypothetical protein